jgi:hypothetical protein
MKPGHSIKGKISFQIALPSEGKVKVDYQENY